MTGVMEKLSTPATSLDAHIERKKMEYSYNDGAAYCGSETIIF